MLHQPRRWMQLILMLLHRGLWKPWLRSIPRLRYGKFCGELLRGETFWRIHVVLKKKARVSSFFLAKIWMIDMGGWSVMVAIWSQACALRWSCRRGQICVSNPMEHESFFEDLFSLATPKTGSKADNFAWIFWDSFRCFSSLESFWLVEVRNIHPVTGGLVEIWNQYESTNRRFVCKHWILTATILQYSAREDCQLEIVRNLRSSSLHSPDRQTNKDDTRFGASCWVWIFAVQ